MKKPRLMVVCGFGLGSSMVLKLTLDGVLKEENIAADTFCVDEATAKGHKFDALFASKEMARLFENIEKPVVIIDDFLSKDEVRQKALDVIEGLLTE
jgi:ascorbate PTS system EIIB component